jgi:FAD/FMN-containing dehydrogenase
MKLSVLLLSLTHVIVGLTTVAPEGCKKLSTDADWPPPAEWKAAMPEVEVHKKIDGAKYPDYVLQAESYKDVQSAVKFCAKNNIRLIIISSGHDFLGVRISLAFSEDAPLIITSRETTALLA